MEPTNPKEVISIILCFSCCSCKSFCFFLFFETWDDGSFETWDGGFFESMDDDKEFVCAAVEILNYGSII